MEEKEYEFERLLFDSLAEKNGVEGYRSAKFVSLLAGALVERGILSREEVLELVKEAAR